jgi:hypothetical protein
MRTSTTVAAALVAGLSVFGMQSQAQASEFTGKIVDLRINTSGFPNPDAGVARVSILVPGDPTACPTTGWYAYQPADAGVRQLWTDALIDAALVDSRRVRIIGTGTCDGFGVEGVSNIDFFRLP